MTQPVDDLVRLLNAGCPGGCECAIEREEAAARIVAQAATIVYMEAEREHILEEGANWMTRAERAESALAAAQADAERMDWLDKHPREATVRVGTNMNACVFYGVSCDRKWSMREAIDAARKVTP